MLFALLSTQAFALDVLIYGPTDYTESTILTNAGHTVTSWGAGTWANKTQSDFEAFDVIVVGDKSCSGPSTSDWSALDSSQSEWTPAVTGRIVVTTMDAGCHWTNSDATAFVENAVAWAGGGNGTGLYVSSDWGRTNYSFMDEIGTFASTRYDANSVTITDSSHALWTADNTITSIGSWGQTYHAYLTSYPSDFSEIASYSSYGVVVVREDCDADGDGDGNGNGTCDGSDCDDTDSSIYTGADEYCDGVDNDCDSTVDESGAIDASTWYEDADGDSYGNASSTTDACDEPSGYTSDDTDCDDTDGDEYPGADEYCDGDDDDCDGDIDEDSAVDVATWYIDTDGDGYGVSSTTDIDCNQPSGYADNADDCDDTDSSEYPGADEVCDGDDDDCDNVTDEDGAVDVLTWYADSDGDGYGDSATTDIDCYEPSGYVADDTDCDDTDSSEYPGADEYCDGDDDDCDGEIDEDESVDVSTWYADTDTDGYGDPAVTDVDCYEPSGFVGDGTDCDDTDADINPGQTDVPYDGIDQDCLDGDECDVDDDGFDAPECEGDDCDDNDSEVYPGAEERWYDGIDQDCSEGSDYDQDGDGYDSASYGGEDCDDANAETYPGAPDEPGDGVINDCDAADEYDADGDGYDGEAFGGDDCDDSNSDINPGAEEIWYDSVDQDCDGNDDDQDGDGYSVDQDCDDEDAALYPNAPGLDADCAPLDSGVFDSGDISGGGGCKGCASGSTPAGWLLLGLAGLLIRRRS